MIFRCQCPALKKFYKNHCEFVPVPSAIGKSFTPIQRVSPPPPSGRTESFPEFCQRALVFLMCTQFFSFEKVIVEILPPLCYSS